MHSRLFFCSDFCCQEKGNSRCCKTTTLNLVLMLYCASSQVSNKRSICLHEWSKDNDTHADVEDAVNAFCIPNTAVMYCWDLLDWDSFLPQWFMPIPGILQFQHFKVSQTDKYHVECRKSPTAETTLIRIVKDNVSLPENSCNLPPVLPAKGLSKKRQDHLQKQAAPYIS